MSQRGMPSTAHEFDGNNQCIHCHMYRVNVLKYVHECTAAREKIADAQFELDKLKQEEQQVKNGE